LPFHAAEQHPKKSGINSAKKEIAIRWMKQHSDVARFLQAAQGSPLQVG
jgi:hypothetical protein